MKLIFLVVVTALSFCCYAQDPSVTPLVVQIPAMGKVKVRENITYKTIGDTVLHFDLYSPPPGTYSGDLPVVILNNGVGSLDLPKWRPYSDWGKLIAANGMMAINYQTHTTHSLDDGEALIDFVTLHAKEYGIDPNRVGMWTSSANVRTGMRLAFERRPSIKALAAFYGGPDSLALMRQDLPVLMVRAALDAQFLNNGVDRFIANALRQDIRIEVINYLEGIHAFDIYTHTDEARQIILRSVDFLKKNLTAPALRNEFVLTNRNFVWLMNHGRVDEGIREFRKVRERNRADRNFQPFYNAVIREDVLNANAYALLTAGRKADALKLFLLMVESYPTSANAYDGLSDVYESMGDREMSLKNLQTCLSLLDKDTTLFPEFRERIRQSAMQRMSRLK